MGNIEMFYIKSFKIHCAFIFKNGKEYIGYPSAINHVFNNMIFYFLEFEIKIQILIGDTIKLKVARKLYDNFLFNFDEKQK